ncbi:L-lysine cyclodeaminase [Planctomycetes bacterium Pan216]|uniref:L-lysine cyclodeaminase n=1 Tax=Kolteria novifilia TaxID=2527975 RepID=A0A518B1S7_9BACT|nr:L-lysine cyclodeaminase [Planctomycetes bacterium Pan216]
MAAIYLREADVARLLSMEEVISALERIFREQAAGGAENIPRGRCRGEGAMLHLLGGASRELDALCFKAYTTTKTSARFLVHLYDGSSGDLLAVVEADQLGRLRTGGTSGLATKLMSPTNASRVGIIGSGRQARTQLEAVAAVRKLESVEIHSRTKESREKFAAEMEERLHVPVRPVESATLAVRDKEIVITATSSRQPVVEKAWLSPGVHLNAMGSNFAAKTELDLAIVGACRQVVVDDVAQAQIEAGELIQAVAAERFSWTRAVELSSLVSGEVDGRSDPGETTLFKSVGTGIQDLALASMVYKLAKSEGVGQPLPY